MSLELIDINAISSIQASLSHLSGLSLSVYGENGNLILPPVSEDKFLSAIKASQKGQDEYDVFLRRSIQKAAQRRDVSIIKGPAAQHYFFIPICVNSVTFVITGGGVFFSLKEFEDFYTKDGDSYGLPLPQLKSWSQEIFVSDYMTILETSRYTQSLFNILLKCDYESSLNEKKYRLTKTILSLISHIELDKKMDEIYGLLVDIMIYLFSADSVSVMVKDNERFRSQRAGGRLKEHLQTVLLKPTGVITEVLEKQMPLHSEDMMEILKLGLSDEVTSIYLFPIVLKNRVIGLIGIFNSPITQEDADVIFDLCRIIGFVFRLLDLQGIYDKRVKNMHVLDIATTRLNPVKEPEMLYDAIVDLSVHLIGAERGSLMLIEGGASYLTVKAARGINKLLLKEIRIKPGEGIAGKVFNEGAPLIVDDIESNEKFFLKRRPNYKTSSFISIPLKAGEKTIGVFNISDKVTGEIFSEEDMAILQSFLSYASIALERSMYYSLAGHLRELSITDSLTGLFNRRYFEERFFEEIQRSERHNLSFSLAIMDIDDFKLFNDTEGHLAGDEVLKNIANIAKDSVRVIDVIARFGGEEFAVIMPQTEKNEAFLVAERIRESIKEQLPTTWKVFPNDTITVTIGIATFPSDGKDRGELIRNSDKALYKGKMEGKDKTVVWGW